MAPFSSLLGLNTGTSLAGTITSDPLRGLRARRARRSRTLNVPNPRISRCLPSLSARLIASSSPSTITAVWFLDTPVCVAISSTKSAFVMSNPPGLWVLAHPTAAFDRSSVPTTSTISGATGPRRRGLATALSYCECGQQSLGSDSSALWAVRLGVLGARHQGLEAFPARRAAILEDRHPSMYSSGIGSGDLSRLPALRLIRGARLEGHFVDHADNDSSHWTPWSREHLCCAVAFVHHEHAIPHTRIHRVHADRDSTCRTSVGGERLKEQQLPLLELSMLDRRDDIADDTGDEHQNFSSRTSS